MKCTKLFIKPSADIWGSMKCAKLVIDEINGICHFIAKFEYEYSSTCVLALVRA